MRQIHPFGLNLGWGFLIGNAIAILLYLLWLLFKPDAFQSSRFPSNRVLMEELSSGQNIAARSTQGFK